MLSTVAAPTTFQSTITKRNIVKLSIACALLVAVMTAIPDLLAQQPAEPHAAPVPSQVISAKKVFIVNATGDHDSRIAKYLGGPDGIYNQFYADVKNDGRFEPVSSPAEADVVLQVTMGLFTFIPNYAGFRLSIIDPKTSIQLWTISEPVDPAFLAKTARKNIAGSLARLTNDLKTLVSGK